MSYEPSHYGPPPGQYPQQPQPPAGPPPPQQGWTAPPRKKGSGGKILLIALGVVVLLCVGLGTLGAIVGDTDGDGRRAAVDTAASATTSPRPSPTPARATTPAAAPTSAKPAAAAKPTYKKITDRQWKQIAKDPDAHLGDTVVVYGEVTQFDAATGTDTFRGNVGGNYQRPSYGYVDYPTNTILTGSETALEDLVEGDLFRANVVVLGSISYDTQIGGETTVPTLQVASIKVTGSVK